MSERESELMSDLEREERDAEEMLSARRRSRLINGFFSFSVKSNTNHSLDCLFWVYQCVPM